MSQPRSRPVMTLSEAAVDRIRQVTANSQAPIVGIRVGVKKGGCAGMEYTMQYAESFGPHDEVVEEKGVKILIEPTAILFLLGTELDFKVDKLKAAFVFNNPNQLRHELLLLRAMFPPRKTFPLSLLEQPH
jgi:iron-sulfur cluster assembly protein